MTESATTTAAPSVRSLVLLSIPGLLIGVLSAVVLWLLDEVSELVERGLAIDLLTGAAVTVAGAAIAMPIVLALPFLHAFFHRLRNPLVYVTLGGIVLGALGGEITLFKCPAQTAGSASSWPSPATAGWRSSWPPPSPGR